MKIKRCKCHLYTDSYFKSLQRAKLPRFLAVWPLFAPFIKSVRGG